MFIKFSDLKNFINNIENLISEEEYICFDKTGFYIKGSNNREEREDKVLQLAISEVNKQVGLQDTMKLSDVANHLKMSKITAKKILEENEIPILNINGNSRILLSDYISLLNKSYKK